MSRAAKILTHRAHRRRHVLPISLLLFLMAWLGLWVMTAHQLNKHIDKWAQQAKANNITLTFKDRYTDGSPWKLHVHVKNFIFKHPKGHRLEADEVVFYLPIWNWYNLSAKIKGLIRGQIFNQSFVTEALKMGLKPKKAKNYEETGLNFWVRTYGLTPHTKEEPLFGRLISELEIEGKVTGPTPDFTSEDSLRIWSSNGGHITLEHLTLNWGELTLSGHGSLTLNQKLQPEGVFSSRLKGLSKALSLCKTQNCLSPMEERMLKVSLNVLARPSNITGNSTPLVPLSIQHGGLFIGPVKITSLPEIKW